MAGQNRKNIFTEIIVGAFMLMVFLALIIFTALTAGMDLITGRGRQTLTFTFTNVAGLRAQDSVIMRGMPVGKIRKLTLTTNGVLVEAIVDEKVALRQGYSASVKSTSLLGGHFLDLVEGDGAEIDAGIDHPLTGTPPHDWMADLSASIIDLRAFIKKIDGDKIASIIDNIDSTAHGLSNIVARVDAGQGTLGKLLSPDDTVYADLQATLASVREFTGHLNDNDGSINRLLADKGELYLSLSNTLHSLDIVSTRLRDGEGTLGKLLSNDDTIYTNIVAITADLKHLVTRVDAGDGTLGKLVNDPSLYNNVEGLVLDARSALDNFRETTPITSFGSLLMGGL